RARPPSRRSRTSCVGSSLPPRALNPAGIVLVDKPAGPTSFAIVAELRRKTGARTGHAGTLDPFATGLLLLLSGSATKIAQCFVGLDKRYLVDIDLTERTSTGDLEGEVVEQQAAPDEEEVGSWLPRRPGGAAAAPRRGVVAADSRCLCSEDRRLARLQARAARRRGRDAAPSIAGGC